MHKIFFKLILMYSSNVKCFPKLNIIEFTPKLYTLLYSKRNDCNQFIE